DVTGGMSEALAYAPADAPTPRQGGHPVSPIRMADAGEIILPLKTSGTSTRMRSGAQRERKFDRHTVRTDRPSQLARTVLQARAGARDELRGGPAAGHQRRPVHRRGGRLPDDRDLRPRANRLRQRAYRLARLAKRAAALRYCSIPSACM